MNSKVFVSKVHFKKEYFKKKKNRDANSKEGRVSTEPSN